MLVTILLGLSVFGINSIFEGSGNIKTDSTSVVKETILHPDSVRKVTTSVLTDTGKTGRPVNNNNADPKKNIKTKDGLVDDVPYF